MRFGQAGSARDRREELPHGAGMVEAVARAPEELSAEISPFRQGRIDRERLLAHLLGALQPPSLRLEVELHPAVCRGQPRPRESEAGVRVASLLEGIDRRVHFFERLDEEVRSPAEIQLVGAPGGSRSDQAAFLGRGQFDLERLRDFSGDLVLHVEDVIESRVDLGSPERAPVGSADELDRHAQPRARALEAAIHDRIDAELAAGLLRVHGTLLVPQHRRRGADQQRLDGRELGDGRVREPDAEVRVARVSREVLEEKHGDGSFPGRIVGRSRRRQRFRGGSSRDRFDRELQVARFLEAVRRIFLQAPPDDPLQTGRDVADARLREFGRIDRQDRVHRFDRGAGAKGAPARQHFVEDGAERKNVRPMISRQAPDLLRRHVSDGPEHGAWLGRAANRRGLRRVPTPARIDLLRQAEVQDFDAPLASDEDVLRLQVAVNDPFLVGGGETLRYLYREIRCLARTEFAPLEMLAQRPALQELGHRVRRSLVRSEVVDRQDVRMGKRRDRFRLALETRERARVGGHRLRKDLDGDVAVESAVARAINLSHASGAQRRQDLVGTEAGSARESHGVSAASPTASPGTTPRTTAGATSGARACRPPAPRSRR